MNAGHHSSGHATHAAHDRHEGHSVQTFRNRFWVSLALTLPILLYAEMLWEWLGLRAPELAGSRIVPFTIGTLIFLYGGEVFLRSAAREIKDGLPGMMTLVALGISAAFGYSVATTFWLEGEGFYWELATLVDIMLLGHWIEMRSIGRARGALAELAKLLPDMAERVRGDAIEEVPVATLQAGDVVLIRPGARTPADGQVIQGESHVNESMLTGESKPVVKRTGDAVVAGAVNQEGSLRVRITKVGDDTALAGIARLVQEAQASKSRAQAIADRAAMVLTYVAIVAGLVTAIAWIVASSRGAGFVIERSVTVIVIACPHALGLAVPLVVSISTSLAARNGLLVRNRLALERARDLDVVVFDKTGTLTKGELGVAGQATAAGWSDDRALSAAVALEKDSEHPLARAIVQHAQGRDVSPAQIEGFEAWAGRGVRGRIDDTDVAIGGPALLEALGAEPAKELASFVEQSESSGHTVVFLLEGKQVVAAFALADVVRDESRDAIARLGEMGVRVAMITGDANDVARSVASDLGIEEYFAQVLPEHKSARIKELQQRGLRVAMVGDGVNDAPALTQADVGIAIGAGTDVAVESADVILVRDDPRDVVRVIDLSRRSYRKMLQNLAWATGYNVFALPLAAGAFAWAGIILPAAVGALLMSASTVVVALNAQLLRRSLR